MVMEIRLEAMLDALTPRELERAACPAGELCQGRRRQKKIYSLTAKKLGLGAGRASRRLRLGGLAAAVAATVFTVGALGVYAASGSRLWNGMRTFFGTDGGDDSLTALQEGTLENNTTHSLEVLENTFRGLNIEYEGTVSAADGSRDGSVYSVFTVKRKNGRPFTEDAEHRWIAGYSCWAPQMRGGQPYRLGDEAAVRCNSDGSLSVTIEASVFPSALGEHKMLFGFTGLYRIEEHGEGAEDILLAREELIQLTQEQFVSSPLAVFEESTDIYPIWQGDMYEDDPAFAAEFATREAEVLEGLERLSDGEYYTGSLRCGISTEDIRPSARAEARADGMMAEVTMFALRIEVSEEVYRLYHREPYQEAADIPEAVVYYTDGSEISLQCTAQETAAASRHYLIFPADALLAPDSVERVVFGETEFRFGD